MRVPVTAGQSLQAAVNVAVAGDVIAVEPAVYPAVLLPEKAGEVTITSSQPLPERRLTAADAGLLPTIQSASVTPSIEGTGAANWKLDGIRIGPTSTGQYNAAAFQGARNITLDRVLFLGGSQGQRRALMLNGRNMTVLRSHLDDVWRAGEESQAICAWDGAGPYTVKDTFAAAAAECIMFGGSPSATPADIPADILIEGCTLFKKPEWATTAVFKNLFELKCAKRVIVRGCTMTGNTGGSQSGWSIVFTVNSDSGAWACIEDVLFEDNLIEGARGVNNLGKSYSGPSGQATRITVRKNRFRLSGDRFAQIGGELGAIAFIENDVQIRTDGHMLILYRGDIWVSGSPETGNLVMRPSLYAAERLDWHGNVIPTQKIHLDSPLNDQETITNYVKVFNTDPDVPPPPPPPPPPPVDDPKIAELKAALAKTSEALTATTAELTELKGGLSEAPDTRDAKTLARYLRSIAR